MESSFDSSLSSNWSNSSGSHTKGDLIQINELKLKNIHLQEMNTQLQISLDNTNSQLQKALQQASLVDGLRAEISSLKVKLHDLTEASNASKSAMKDQICELEHSIATTKEKYTKQNDALTKELKKQIRKNNKIKDEKTCLFDQIQQLTTENQIIVDQLAKVNNQKSKLKEKINSSQKTVSELKRQVGELLEIVNDGKKENEDKKIKIEKLNENIESLKLSLDKAKTEVTSKTKELDNYSHSVIILEANYDRLKDDLDTLSEERNCLVQLVQKLHSSLCLIEEQNDSLRNQVSTLTTKAKKAASGNSCVISDKIDISNVTFPFSGETDSKVKNILQMDHFQPIQKLQLILNMAAKTISHLENSLEKERSAAELKDELISKRDVAYQTLYDLLFSIVRELKNLECTEENKDAVAFCESDQKFLDFVARECTAFENLPETAVFLGPLFIPTEIFEEGNTEARRALIEKVSENDRNLATLIAAMFLINLRLKKQVAVLSESCSHRDSVNDALQQLGVDDFSALPNLVEEYQSQIEHLKETRKEIHKSLVNAHNTLSDREETEEALKRQIKSLKERIEELTNENKKLREDIGSVNRELSENNDENSHESNGASIQHEIDYMKNTIKELRSILKKKTEENEAIKNEMSDKLALQKKETNSITRNSAQQEAALKAQINDLQTLVSCFEEKLKKEKVKGKKAMRTALKECESKMKAASDKLDAEKANHVQAINEANAATLAATTNNRQLTERLEESEAQNRELLESNSVLKQSIRTLESRVNLIQEQFQKEKKLIIDSNTSNIIGLEAKYQKELKEQKAKIEGEKNRITDFIASRLGSLYGVCDMEFDENQVNQILGRIQSDLCRLQFFQNQATLM